MMNRIHERLWQNLLPPQLITDGLASKVRNNIVTPHDAPIPDCMTCGACCQTPPCVGVRPSDQVDPELYWDITTEGETSEIVVDRYMRRNGETLACAALEGNIGENVACNTYETRPKMCRDFETGSDRCHALRRAYGIEPFLTLDEMSDALQKLDNKPVTTDPSHVIRNAQIKEDPETGNLTINALMKDGTLQLIHTYNTELETWMQFEFDGLLITEAQALIDSRRLPVDVSA